MHKTIRLGRWPLAAALAVSVVLFSWDEPAHGIEIYLKRSCVVSGDTLLLSDLVASASGLGPSIDLRSLRVPYTAGRLAVIMPQAIRDLLKHQFPETIILVGQKTLVLPQGRDDPARMRFYESLLEFIASNTPASVSRLEIEMSGDPFLSEESEMAPIFETASGNQRNGVRVGPMSIRYRSPERVSLLSGSVGVIIHAFVSAAVPAMLIKGGERFNEDALQPREVDLALCQEDLLVYHKAIGDYTASATLYPDEPVPLKKITRTLYVRSGDKIFITFMRKNITIGLRGRALGSGGLDDRVAVKADGTERKFQALVTGDREVLVELR